MDKKMSLAHYYRYLWEKPGLIVVIGEAAEIYNGWMAYNARYSISESDADGTTLLGRLMAGAGLAAVSLADRESWGWSLALPDSPLGLFCAVEPEGMVCGCVLESEPEKHVGVVQRQKTKAPFTQSHITLKDGDPVKAVETYFEEAEQSLFRIAVSESGRGALVRPLPQGDLSVIDGLSDEELIERCYQLADNEEAKLMEEVLLFYECRCNDEKILNMITSLPDKDRHALWKDTNTLDISCPRCGRGFSVTRKQ